MAKQDKIAVFAGQKYRAKGKSGHWRYVIVKRLYKQWGQPYVLLQEITRTGNLKGKDIFPSYLTFTDGQWVMHCGYERVE